VTLNINLQQIDAIDSIFFAKVIKSYGGDAIGIAFAGSDRNEIHAAVSSHFTSTTVQIRKADAARHRDRVHMKPSQVIAYRRFPELICYFGRCLKRMHRRIRCSCQGGKTIDTQIRSNVKNDLRIGGVASPTRKVLFLDKICAKEIELSLQIFT